MRPLGIFLIVLAVLVPVPWFISLAAKHDPVALFSQYLGAAALVAMGITQLLATRFPGCEIIFGGLDRIYVLHKWVAVSALIAAALHDTIDADIRNIGSNGPLVETGETLGEIGLYGMIVLGVVSVITFVPYHYWKWSHRLMGLFYAMAAAHFLMIAKPFAYSEPLGLYVGLFCAAGVLSYLYLLVLKPFFPGPAIYKVSAVNRLGGATEVVLMPEGKGIRHQPGQFAFVAFDVPGLEEAHPYTISAAPDEARQLRFTIKKLGAYTTRLAQQLEAGATAKVTGGYGHFRMPRGKAPQIWIGAGIGVTPFLAFARSLSSEPKGPIRFYYCVPDRAKACFIDELEAIATRIPNFELVLMESSRGDRLDASRIALDAGPALADARIFFCGPKGMREGLKSGLAEKGVKPGRFHYEEFEMRSGLGIRKLLSRLPARFRARNDAGGLQAAMNRQT